MQAVTSAVVNDAAIQIFRIRETVSVWPFQISAILFWAI